MIFLKDLKYEFMRNWFFEVRRAHRRFLLNVADTEPFQAIRILRISFKTLKNIFIATAVKGPWSPPSGSAWSLLSRSETCTLASSLEAVMGSDVCHALWLFLSPMNISCSLVTYSLGPVCYVLWGTVGKGGCPRGLSWSKEADTERVIKWWRLLEAHRIGGPNQIGGGGKLPWRGSARSFLLEGEQESAKQRKWCFVDRGRECAKVKRREKHGLFGKLKEAPYSFSLSGIYLCFLF